MREGRDAGLVKNSGHDFVRINSEDDNVRSDLTRIKGRRSWIKSWHIGGRRERREITSPSMR